MNENDIEYGQVDDEEAERGLDVLTEAECLQLFAEHDLGRVAIVVDG